MILRKDEISTKVLILPYEESSICSEQYIQTGKIPIEITSVPNYEDSLVRIRLPDGESVVANASQIITAIKKCIL